ncbi:MAG: threonine/serine dehydratase [Candidatus Hodarchaeales archaeon]|jgi:threonine dehydratase
MNTDTVDITTLVEEAEKRIRDIIRETPIEYSPFLSEIGKCNVYLKLENQQLTGSFKFRGAMNKILTLTNKEIITSSTGNHGLAIAHALSITGGKGSVYLPKNTAKTKLDALGKYKLKKLFYGNDSEQAEVHARMVAEKENKEFISPYNDLDIIGGQGTIGFEIYHQLKQIDAVLVSVGGGGLISGIAGYLKNKNRDIMIIGCLPENSPVMYESIKAGKIIKMESKQTLSDGTAGGIEPNAITFHLCQRLVNQYFTINEDEIANAIRLILEQHHMIIEGAAGLTVAGFLKNKDHFKGKNVVLILCGANIGIDQLKSIICC